MNINKTPQLKMSFTCVIIFNFHQKFVEKKWYWKERQIIDHEKRGYI